MSSSARENAGRDSTTPAGIRTLVVGYGNELRGDDGAGPAVARLIGDRGIPDVTVETFHQLLPEHAVPIAAAELVIFVDATRSDGDEVTLRRLHPSVQPQFCGHRCDPETLLHWCGESGSPVPEAWFVNVPGTDFGLGEGLSPASERHVRSAVTTILGLIENHP